MNFSNIKIARRLQLAFGVVIAMLLATVLVALSGLHQLNDSTANLAKGVWPRAKTANSALDRSNRSYARLSQIAATSDDALRVTANQRLSEHFDVLNRAISDLDGLLDTEKGKALNAQAKLNRDVYVRLASRVVSLSMDGKHDEATALAFGDAYKAMMALSGNLREQTEFQEKRFSEASIDAERIFTSSRSILIGAAALAVLLAIAAAILITRSIVRPLNEAVKVARTVAASDLTSTIDIKSTDETGQLMQALKDMNTALQTMVSEVRIGSDTIASASSEIASGNLELSSRTEQQASSLEETASSMEQMTLTVKQNAENARQANGLATTASDVARKGGAVVSQVVNTMGAISIASKKIVDIISVIDGIAFQTNILALNAAVEAARAGEQGRGFAVVASEVSNLAQRSASAAKEIKNLIDDSVKQVELGSKLVNDAGNTMGEVVTSVQRVTDIMAEISSASREQETGIEQINMAITEMDAVTQQNAALVEEAAAAAGSLEEQSTALAQLVSRFKVHVATAMPKRAAAPYVSHKMAPRFAIEHQSK